MKKILIAIAVLFLMTTQVMAQAIYREKKDNFTGEVSKFVTIQDLAGNGMVLAWYCYYRLRISLSHPFLVGNIDGNIIVRYKFDDDEPLHENGFLSSLDTNHKSTDFNKNKVSSFTKKALDSSQVMIRIIDPSNDEKITSTFKLDGFSEAFPKLQCY